MGPRTRAASFSEMPFSAWMAGPWRKWKIFWKRSPRRELEPSSGFESFARERCERWESELGPETKASGFSGQSAEVREMKLLKQLSHELEDLVASAAPAVVGVEHRRGQGTGVILPRDGYILTQRHVLHGFVRVCI